MQKINKQLTISSLVQSMAINNNIEVLYITDVATFKLTKKGLELIEVNKDINIEKDILNKMEFKPEIDLI